MKCLFVYSFRCQGVENIGTVDGEFPKYPPTIESVRAAEKVILNKFGFDRVVIIDWKELS